MPYTWPAERWRCAVSLASVVETTSPSPSRVLSTLSLPVAVCSWSSVHCVTHDVDGECYSASVFAMSDGSGGCDHWVCFRFGVYEVFIIIIICFALFDCRYTKFTMSACICIPFVTNNILSICAAHMNSKCSIQQSHIVCSVFYCCALARLLYHIYHCI